MKPEEIIKWKCKKKFAGQATHPGGGQVKKKIKKKILVFKF